MWFQGEMDCNTGPLRDTSSWEVPLRYLSRSQAQYYSMLYLMHCAAHVKLETGKENRQGCWISAFAVEPSQGTRRDF